MVTLFSSYEKTTRVQADRLNLITLINANGWGKWQCKNEFPGMKRSVFLDHVRKVSASTQNQALNALVFLYKKVLKIACGA